jgi:hypothetical protein
MKRLWLALALALGLLVPASAQVPANQGIPTVPGIPITASGGAKRFTYICGFAATAGGATAAAVVNLTITNLVTGTATYTYGAVAGAGVPSPSLVVPFSPCLPANAANTAIVVSMPSLGTGNTNATVSAWGYQR